MGATRRLGARELLQTVLDEDSWVSWDAPPLSVAAADSGYAAELTDRGAHVDLRLVRDLHAMLLRPGRWHRAVARFAAAAIRDANSADRPN